MEAHIAMSSIDTKVLMASYYKTSQCKGWIFDFDSAIYIYFQKELFNSLVAKEEGKRKGLSKWWMAWLARSSPLEQSMLHEEWDNACSGGGSVCPRGTV